MPKGFYLVTAPQGADYVTRLQVSIALPHGSDQIVRSLRGALSLFFDKFGIHSSGMTDPAEALKKELETARGV